jgi:hypothetical protein
MIIKVKVDRRECFRQGINQNEGFVKLDIDPATLTLAEREWLLARLEDDLYSFNHNNPTNPIPTLWNGLCPPTLERFFAFMQEEMRTENAGQPRHLGTGLGSSLLGIAPQVAGPPPPPPILGIGAPTLGFGGPKLG